MMKSRYGKLLIAFFALMLALTAVSRAADSATVAKVFTEKPKQATLAHQTLADGVIQASDQEYVRGEEGTFLKKVHVGEGQDVKKGDTLFTLDLKTVKEQLLKAETELAAQRLNLRKAEMERGGTPAERAAVEDAGRRLERARADSDLNTELNGGKQMLADRRAIEDAQADLDSAEKQLAEASQRNTLDLELSRLQIQEKERAVKRLQNICGSGGQVVAETGGTVGNLTAKAGEKLTDGSLCTLVPESAEYVFEAELDDEDAKYMNIGDEVSLTVEGRNVPLDKIKIRSMGSDGGRTRVTASLPADAQVSHGMRASISHSSVSQSYENTIPIGALRGSEESYYVLTLSETNTVLGNETVAKKQEVTLIDKDSKRAVIQERVDGKVITDSSKPVEAGDRVREVDDGSGK